MKKFVLSLCLLATVFVGRSQVILNEMITNSGGNQFLELYNSGTTEVPLKCYSIVSLGLSTATITKLNIIDLPDNAVIPAKGYYTLGTSNTVLSKAMNYNWNAATQPVGASFRRYNVSGNSLTTAGASNDFLLESTQGNPKIAVFLFDGSTKDANNNVAFVNGLVGYGTPIPSYVPSIPPAFNFATRPKFADPTSTCGTTFIDWSKITIAEYTEAATGGNNNTHGYVRAGNGLCGAWSKFTNNNNYTPNTANPIGTSNIASGALNTIENITCGGTQVAFTINTTANVQYPVSVELYYDNGDKYLDANEYQNKSIAGITSLPFSGTFTITQTTNVYLVYKTALGCVSKVQLVSAATAGALTTTQVNICSNNIDFSILDATNEVATYGFPIQVQLYQNNGDVTFGAEDVTIGTPITVTSASNTIYSIAVPAANKGDQFLLAYSSPVTCYNKVVAPSAPVGTLATTQHNICGDLMAYTVTGLTGNNYKSSYLFPMTVELHVDADGSQTYNPSATNPDEEVVQGLKVVNSFSALTDSITIPDASKRYLVVYKTAQECLSTVGVPTSATGEPTTTQDYFCGKRIDYTVTAGTFDAALFSLPIEVSVYWDESGNGNLNDEDTTKPKYLLGRDMIFTFSPTTHQIALDKTDQNKAVILVYKTYHTCLSKTAVPTASTTGTVTVNGEITFDGSGNAIVNYFLTDPTVSNAYPLELNVYEDKNRDKVLDNNEKTAIGTTQVASDPRTNGVYPQYTATLKNDKSFAIITAASTIGCSSAFAPIVNSSAVGLPVHFKSFTANRKEDKVLLKWETASEQNNKGFHLQRNTGGGWKDIAFVFSQNQNGNSASDLSYSFTDLNPSKGVSQYRILQEDLDGSGHYSQIRSVNGSGTASKLLLFPNPSNTGMVTLLFDSEGAKNVTVSDMSGRIIRQYKNVTGSSLDIKNVNNGFYNVQVFNIATGTTAVEKFIIKKR